MSFFVPLEDIILQVLSTGQVVAKTVVDGEEMTLTLDWTEAEREEESDDTRRDT